MSKKKNLILLAGAGVAYWYYKKYEAAKVINYNIASVALNFQGVFPILKIILNVQNVSNQSIMINSMAGNLYINNTNVGTVSNFQETIIKGNSQTPYEITVKLNLLGVVSDLVSLITNGTGNAQTLQLVVNANVEGMIIPVNAKYQIG